MVDTGSIARNYHMHFLIFYVPYPPHVIYKNQYIHTCVYIFLQGSTKAFMVDAVSTSLGAVMGTSPVTTYIESAPGIEEGGKISAAECCSVCVSLCLPPHGVSDWNCSAI